jgi:hypothetical protein
MLSLTPDLQILIRRGASLGPVTLTFELLVQDPSFGPKLKKLDPVRLHLDPGRDLRQASASASSWTGARCSSSAPAAGASGV